MTATGKSRDDAEDDLRLWDFEAENGFDYSSRKTAYIDGDITAVQLRNALIKFGGYDPDEADLQIKVYDLEAQGYDGVTVSNLQRYNEFCQLSGVPFGTYMQITRFAADTKNDVDPETGKAIPYSAMKKIMAEINSHPGLTSSQKTAIARSFGWSEKNIQKYKTWS